MKIEYTIYNVDGSSETKTHDIQDRAYTEPRMLLSAIDAIWQPYARKGIKWEHVTVFHNGTYTDMFVDELGFIDGLPLNAAATAIYRNNVIVHEGLTDQREIDSMPSIYGPAIVLGKRIWY